MEQTRYACIIKAPGYHRATHAARMASPAFHAEFIGVEDFDEAPAAAEALVAAGARSSNCAVASAQEATRLRRLPA